MSTDANSDYTHWLRSGRRMDRDATIRGSHSCATDAQAWGTLLCGYARCPRFASVFDANLGQQMPTRLPGYRPKTGREPGAPSPWVDGWAGHFSKARSGAPPVVFVSLVGGSIYTSREKVATRRS